MYLTEFNRSKRFQMYNIQNENECERECTFSVVAAARVEKMSHLNQEQMKKLLLDGMPVYFILQHKICIHWWIQGCVKNTMASRYTLKILNSQKVLENIQ